MHRDWTRPLLSYELYKDTIDMCVNLQDRFTVTDVWQDPAVPEDEWFYEHRDAAEHPCFRYR